MDDFKVKVIDYRKTIEEVHKHRLMEVGEWRESILDRMPATRVSMTLLKKDVIPE